MKHLVLSPTYRWLMSLFILAVHGVFFLQVSAASGVDPLGNPGALPVQWFSYVVPAGLLGLGLGLAASLIRLPWHMRGVVLLLRIMILYVLVIPMRGQVWLALTLFLSLVIEVFVLFSMPAAVISLVVILLGYWQMPLPEYVWGVPLGTPLGKEGVLAGFFALWSIIVGGTARHAWDRYYQVQQTMDHQQVVIKEMAGANLDFQEYAVQVERRTMEQERQRITREIHDLMGYTLTSLRMLFEAGDILIDRDPMELRRLMGQGKIQLEESQQEIRRALYELRDAEQRSFPILNRIRELTVNFAQATGVSVDLQTTNLRGELSRDIENLLYRAVQEGMTNAFLHGRARSIQIILHHTGERIMLSIIDDGFGSKQLSDGIGLRGMRERLEPLGGVLKSENLHPGFSLSISIPWEKENSE